MRKQHREECPAPTTQTCSTPPTNPAAVPTAQDPPKTAAAAPPPQATPTPTSPPQKADVGGNKAAPEPVQSKPAPSAAAAPQAKGKPSGPLKVHGLSMSASCLPVLAVAAEAGLPVQLEIVDLMAGAHLSAPFKEMNPMHCIPTLEDGAFSVWEGRAVAKYLCNQYQVPEHLYPSEAKARALCDMALDVHHSIWYKRVTAVVLYPAVGWAPPVSAAEMQAAEEAFHADIWPALKKMISQAGGGGMLGGTKPNIADLFYVTHIETTASKVPSSFVAKHAELRAYAAAVKAQCPQWDSYMGGAVKDFYAPPAPVTQSAFVFAKPHANTPEVQELIKKKFAEVGIKVLSDGEIAGPVIDDKKYIDQHYYSIASKATILKSSELNVPADKFKESFGEEWATVVEEKRCFNAMDICTETGMSAGDLETKWNAAKDAGKVVKFGGGFYCGLVDEEKKLYTFNAFFMSMRGKFTAADAAVHYYVVEWDAGVLSWADFRGKVLGPTDPASAPAGSLRGTINADWEKLGLKAPPNTGDNGVHASASPLEGLAERANWLQVPVAEDVFGKRLVAAGLSEEMIKAWTVDPQVVLPGQDGKKGSLFDQLEDLDLEPCLAKCKDIAAAQPQEPEAVEEEEEPPPVKKKVVQPTPHLGGKNCPLPPRPAVVTVPAPVLVPAPVPVASGSGVTQSAFVFAKPHANTPEVQELIKKKFAEVGIKVLSDGEIAGPVIDDKKYIDQHYYSIASKATILKSSELNVPADKFKESFGEEWATVVEEKRCFNAMDICTETGMSAGDLETKWNAAKDAGKVVKFGGGFYCGLVDEEKKLYTFNAFFMSMRGKFTAADAAVHYYVVEWDAGVLSWADFRGKVLGPTDPVSAPAGSLRGTINADWEKLGLKAPPNTGDNGVHASASPLEGLAERANWLQVPVAEDVFGKRLVAAGLSEEMIKAWTVDPQVVLPGQDGKKGSLFDQLEDLDLEPCLAKCKDIAAAQLAAAPQAKGKPSGPLKVHGLPMSASCLPVLAVAAEAGLPVQLEIVDLMAGAHLSAPFKEMNPMHCIPTLEDGAFSVWEGRAVAKYLCNQYQVPEHLYPSEAKARALCDMALDVHHSIWYKRVTAVVLYPAVGWAPPVSAAEMQAAEEAFHADIWPALKKMISQAGGGGMLGGTKPNIADLFYVTHIETTASKVPSSFVAKHAELRAYAAAVKAQCPQWDSYMGGAVKEFYAPPAPVTQSAFVFAKPHANTPEVQELIKKKFAEVGIKVLSDGEIAGPVIDDKKYIDQHYYSIASKATILKSSELNVPADKFKESFGEEWATVVEEKRCFNAMDICTETGMSAGDLETKWNAAKDAGKVVKFGGGFYCGLVDEEKKLYTFNAFFMSMRGKFTAADAAVHYYVVEWDAGVLSWADFRGKVLGPTDPASAPAGSLRGTINADWEKLGLKAPPNTGDNGVHASASPLEGLAERANWLQVPVAEDVFGKRLVAAGLSEEMIKAWTVDPQVVLPGQDGKKGSLFDQLEDLDLEPCLAKCKDIAAAQPAGGGRSGVTQSAFVFAKPHANTPEVQELIKKKFAEVGIKVLSDGEIAGPVIDDKKYIDQHYYSIASKATILKSSELNVPADKFKESFGEEWATVVEEKRCFNAMDICTETGMSAGDLETKWNAAKDAGKVVKFGGGFYCGLVDEEKKLYTFNAFFMSMRGKFTAADAAVHYYVVEWDAGVLSWADFRGKVLGPTDPASAPAGSLRGTINADWEKLGLKAPPNTGDNGVHASASPLEGLAERANWLQVPVAEDVFGKRLVAAGLSEEMIKAWTVDPQVVLPGQDGKKGSLFDQLEDLDLEPCLAKCKDIAAAQPAAAPQAKGKPSGPLKVHGLPMSASCLPVLAVAAEAGLPVQLEIVDLMAGAHLSAPFKEMNPMHCIPTLEDGAFSVWEGRAVAKYLCNQYQVPEHLYPSEAKARALCDMALDVHHSIWYKRVTAVVLYPAVGWAPPVSAAEMQAAEEAFHADIWPALKKMISQAGGGGMLGGTKPNIADLFYVTHIETTASKVPSSFVAKHAELRAYAAAVKAQCPQWDSYMGGAVKEFYAPPAPVTQSAFVFAKPHANTPEVQELIKKKFAEVGIKVLSDGEIAGPVIDDKKYIDQHYYSIASKATILKSSELNVPADKFKESFGEEWATVVEEKRCFNAMDICTETGMSAGDLETKWNAAKDAGKVVKFGGGFYCGLVDEEKKLYTFNAFFMSMRGKFTAADAAVHYYVVEWDAGVLSWADFRGKVLGPTDPASAPAGSLRGTINADWEKLGLKAPPNTGDNGVHASASPLEGLAERANWLQVPVAEDVFGKRLVAAGLSEEMIKAWTVDPQVVLPGQDGKKGSLFDQLEDLDLEPCLAKCKDIAAAQPAGGGGSGVTQSAFVFAKPHANTPEVQELIKKKFAEVGIKVLSDGEIAGPVIDDKKYIDQHYYSIASKATILKSSELNVPADKFKESFGEEWATVVEEKRCFNAMDICTETGMSAGDLETKWNAAKDAGKVVKFGGGFYCGLVDEEKKLYTFNAFFMSMRGKFTAADAAVHYYVVEWDAGVLSWADFRGKVLGPTDPASAPAGSLRGTINADWEKLGLKAPPNTGDNGVHASASPLEGLAERANWLQVPVAEDVFGKRLVAAGLSEEMIKAWTVDPQVVLPGQDGKKGSLFDQLEDLDLEPCLAKCKDIAAAQPAGGGGSGVTQSAFVFAKPHANTPEVQELIKKKFAEVGIKVLSDGEIAGPVIDDKKYIDQHYYSIASKATILKSSELNVPADKFKESFGEEWATVVEEKRCFNAMDICTETGMSAGDLETKWNAAKDAGKVVKFGGGFYCGLVDEEKKLYTFNAFFMSMRGKFTAADAAVHYYVVEWDAGVLSWADFRGKVLGPTDPASAPAGSLRGTINADWEKLGLKAPPNTGDNGVHASASPLEGLAERANWLQVPVAEDVFGKRLVAAGLSEEMIKAWTVDPQVVLPGQDGKKGSLFDQLEDLDLEPCLAKCKDIAAAQPAGGGGSGVTQSAFVFAKPHANTPEVQELIKKKFAEVGIKVLSDGEIAGPVIDDKKYIDQHYYSIASKATILKSSELNVPADKFKESFGEEWATVVEEKRCFNAMDICTETGMSAGDLETKWNAAKDAGKVVKFGGGFYCGLVDEEKKLYTFNAFFMSMRGKFTAADAAVHYYVVEWDAGVLSWADFRGKVLGPTDPASAPAGSLRGTINADWEKLGLKAPPNTGDNGVHASASPLEGLAERANWLQVPVAEDVFGKRLVAAGLSEEMIKAWTVDPQVVLPGQDGKKGSLFDQLEDLDLEPCLAKCKDIAAAQPAGGGGSGVTQSAFVFAKPHANTPEVQELIKKKFAEVGIKVLSDGEIAGPVIDDKKYIDQHYYSIASKATILKSSELNVPADKFKESFGEEWATVVEEKRCFNAMDICTETGMSAGDLETKWNAAKDAGKVVKFGGGFYCGLVDEEKKLYTFNAFFMSMRGKFTAADAAVHYYVVEWDAGVLSWADFRGKVLGPTDPASAPAGSLRGTINADWEKLGLKAPPNTGDNGVHASASPLEGLAERANWLQVPVAEDVFGKRLVAAGLSEEMIKAWTVDPQVVLPGQDGKKGSLFDQLEDLDLEPCLAKCKDIAAAQPAGGGRSGVTQSAFVFAKPHANTPEVQELIKKKFAEVGIKVLSDGEIAGPVIDDKKYIDQHYYSIASKATILKSSELNVPADKFKESFGEEWATVVEEKRCFNAMDICTETGMSAGDLETKWNAAKDAGKVVKFGGGFYCGLVDEEKKLYTFNAFFMSMRGKFTAADAAVHYYVVEWDAGVLSWADFRGKVLGPTDPASAPAGSLRGTINADWEKLGLKAPPNTGDNGVHASASPLEGLAERANWLQVPVAEDVFGKRLVAAGLSEEMIKAWTVDPQVVLPGQDGKKGSLFDQLEDLDLEPCLAKCKDIAAAQPAGGGGSGVTQSAFVFAKPHANTPEVQELIKKKFAEVGIKVLSDGEIAGPVIDDKKYIDQHYYSIASKATILKSSELNVPADKFKESFGEEWATVVEEKRCFNAMDICTETGMSAGDLETKWNAAKDAGKVVKFGGGFYCGLVDEEKKLYTFNAFFMSMRGKFTAADAAVHYYVVEWDAGVLSWADFRGKVLGPTDPASAPAGSLRGTINADWEKLGLKAPPNTGDNGVHASASPLEGLAERANWLQVPVAEDVFGKRLVAAGLSEEMIKAWTVDPQVVLPGQDGKKGSLFDQLEDLDLEPCLAKCKDIAAAQP